MEGTIKVCFLLVVLWHTCVALPEIVNETLYLPGRKDCADTVVGTDYIGNISTTRNDTQCKPWTYLVDKIEFKDADDQFPGTVEESKNYCRNPALGTLKLPSYGHYRNQPWCLDVDNKEKKCNVPLCALDYQNSEVCFDIERNPQPAVTKCTCYVTGLSLDRNNAPVIQVKYEYWIDKDTECNLNIDIELAKNRYQDVQDAICKDDLELKKSELLGVYIPKAEFFFANSLNSTYWRYRISYSAFKSISIIGCGNDLPINKDAWTVNVESFSRVFTTILIDPSPSSTSTTSSSSDSGSLSSSIIITTSLDTSSSLTDSSSSSTSSIASTLTETSIFSTTSAINTDTSATSSQTATSSIVQSSTVQSSATSRDSSSTDATSTILSSSSATSLDSSSVVSTSTSDSIVTTATPPLSTSSLTSAASSSVTFTGATTDSTGTSGTTSGTGPLSTDTSSSAGVIPVTGGSYEMDSEEWKLVLGLGISMCILLVLLILLACFIVHVCCCKERAKRRREEYFQRNSILKVDPDHLGTDNKAYEHDGKVNGAVPGIIVTEFDERAVHKTENVAYETENEVHKTEKVVQKTETVVHEETETASALDVNIDIDEETPYATFYEIANEEAAMDETKTTSTTTTTTVIQATNEEENATVVQSAVHAKTERVKFEDIALNEPEFTVQTTEVTDIIKLNGQGPYGEIVEASESTHHPDVLLATASKKLSRIKIAENGRIKAIPRPFVLPPGEEARASIRRSDHFHSLPRVRQQNSLVHSYSPHYTLANPSRHRRFMPVNSNNIRFLATPQRSPVFLMRNQGMRAAATVPRGNEIPMTGMVLKTTSSRQHRYRKRNSRQGSVSSANAEKESH